MRLDSKTLSKLKEKGIKVPSYDRSTLKSSCVHIGLGHFHRAHFLSYMEELLNAGLTDSGVYEIDFMPPAAYVKSLEEQAYLYSLSELSPDGSENVKVIGAITGYANQTTEPEKVFSLLTSPETTLISLTITEKGYCYSDETDSIDWNNPAIAHDLTSDEPSRSVIGGLAAALNERMKQRLPVTIMSCDNVPENGEMLKSCILQFAERKYPDLTEWIADNVSFPCTMVDRITPGTSEKDIAHLKEKYDLEDGSPVHSEDFIQWVIEDDFKTKIPPFAKAGALVVKDVKPYELMKIRLLNGAHSALSYPSILLGMTMVHEAMEDEDIRRFIRSRYMEDITTTLSPVPGVDVEAYKDKLISRFSNRSIADTLLRLASDGSKKIANAIIKPLVEAKSGNRNALILSLALWQYYYTKPGVVIDDPKGAELLKAAGDSEAFLHIAGLDDAEAIAKAKEFLTAIQEQGIRTVIRSV